MGGAPQPCHAMMGHAGKADDIKEWQEEVGQESTAHLWQVQRNKGMKPNMISKDKRR